jgi:hypothetical protein
MDTTGHSTGHSAGRSAGHTVHSASGRAIRLPITPAQFRSLICYAEDMIAMLGCDSTLHHTEAWARAHGVAWGRLARALRGIGGFCDCEVGINVAIGEIADAAG